MSARKLAAPSIWQSNSRCASPGRRREGKGLPRQFPMAPAPRSSPPLARSQAESASATRDGEVNTREARVRHYTARSGSGGASKEDLAGEYHSRDFEWSDLRDEVEKTLAEREARAQSSDSATTSERVRGQGERWEAFHRKVNSTARFFKEKRYILQEFPILLNEDVTNVVEFGCGNGSTVLPLLKGNPKNRVLGLDFSQSAVDYTRKAVERAGFGSDRFEAKRCDLAASLADQEVPEVAEGDGNFDCCLMIFLLSAAPPSDHDAIVRNAWRLLRPGGLVLFRDYGKFDLTELRFPEDQRVGTNLYQRQDGTLTYYFELEDLEFKFEASGLFEKVETDYVCVQLYNRKKDFEMRRVFAHAIFRRI